MDDRLNRQRWLDAGLERIAAEGAGGLRIMSIAQRLGVTKGSFYWHFRDLAGYEAALLQEWEASRTRQIIEHVETTGGDATARLRTLITLTVSSDARLAEAVRSWASTDASVGDAVARVDKIRLAYLATLLREIGWPKVEASTLARWAYCALLGHFRMPATRLSTAEIALLLNRFTTR